MSLQSLVRTAGLALAVPIVFSGCGGGGGGSSALPGSVSAASNARANVTMSISIPNTGTSSASATRSLQAVPSSSTGIAVFVYAAVPGTQPSTPTLVGDLSLTPTGGNQSLCVPSGGARQCTITFSAPVGTDVVSVQLYDAEPSGNPLAIPASAHVVAMGVSQAFTVSANGQNGVTVPLNIPGTVNPDGSASFPALPSAGNASVGITGGTVNVSIPAGGVPSGEQVSVQEVLTLTIPLSSIRRAQTFVQGSGNTFIYGIGFAISGGSLPLTQSLTVSATFQITTGLATTLGLSGSLNVAQQTGTSYTDVGSVAYSVSGTTLTINGVSGILGTGTYILYLAPPGSRIISSTASADRTPVVMVGGVAYAIVPAFGGITQVPVGPGASSLSFQNIPIKGISFPACATDPSTPRVYCVSLFSGGSQTLGFVDYSSGASSPTTGTVTLASGVDAFAIAYDPNDKAVIILDDSGYEAFNVSTGSKIWPTSTKGTDFAESLAYNSASNQIFDAGSSPIGLFTVGSLASSTVAGGNDGEQEGAAVDPGLGIVALSWEGTNQLTLFSATNPSSKADLTATFSGALTSFAPYTGGLSIDLAKHYLVMGSDGGSSIGVAALTGIAQPVSYRFTDLPSFSVGSDPHNVTAFDGSDGRAYGVFVSGDLGTVAVVDLDKFLSITVVQSDGHTVAPADFSNSGALTLYATGIVNGCARARAPLRQRRSLQTTRRAQTSCL
jgi:hypothetical protein